MTTNVDPSLRAAEQRADEAREALTNDIGAIAARGKEAATIDIGKLAVGGVVGLTLAALGARSARLVGRAIAGAAAGAVAGAVMKKLQTTLGASAGEPPNVKAAEKIAGPLAPEERPRAGALVHYGVASATGTVYELLHDFPGVTLARGALFGTAVWLVADEVIVPALGLSEPPWRAPPSSHARALVAHVTYGVTLDAILRVVRAAFR